MPQSFKGHRKVPYCFSRSYVQFQGSPSQEIANLTPFRFKDNTSILNSQMAMKWCTQLRGAWKMCFFFQGHISNFQGHTAKKIANLSKILVFNVIRPFTAFKSLRFALFCSQRSNWQKFSFGSDNGLVLNRREAINWTSDGLVSWYIYVLLGFNKNILVEALFYEKIIGVSDTNAFCR